MISNIMIVDDSKIDLFINQKIIEKFNSNIAVNSFSNPVTALKFLDTLSTENKTNALQLPDAILLDVNMPEMNGFEFLKALKQLNVHTKKKIAVFILSSSRCYKDVHRAKKNNSCVGYISKPLTLEKLNGIEKQTIIKKNSALTHFFLSLV